MNDERVKCLSRALPSSRCQASALKWHLYYPPRNLGERGRKKCQSRMMWGRSIKHFLFIHSFIHLFGFGAGFLCVALVVLGLLRRLTETLPPLYPKCWGYKCALLAPLSIKHLWTQHRLCTLELTVADGWLPQKPYTSPSAFHYGGRRWSESLIPPWAAGNSCWGTTYWTSQNLWESLQ